LRTRRHGRQRWREPHRCRRATAPGALENPFGVLHRLAAHPPGVLTDLAARLIEPFVHLALRRGKPCVMESCRLFHHNGHAGFEPSHLVGECPLKCGDGVAERSKRLGERFFGDGRFGRGQSFPEPRALRSDPGLDLAGMNAWFSRTQLDGAEQFERPVWVLPGDLHLGRQHVDHVLPVEALVDGLERHRFHHPDHRHTIRGS
jgi:hypothetical protein